MGVLSFRQGRGAFQGWLDEGGQIPGGPRSQTPSDVVMEMPWLLWMKTGCGGESQGRKVGQRRGPVAGEGMGGCAHSCGLGHEPEEKGRGREGRSGCRLRRAPPAGSHPFTSPTLSPCGSGFSSGFKNTPVSQDI